MKVVIKDHGEYPVGAFEETFTLADLIFLKRTTGMDEDQVEAALAVLQGDDGASSSDKVLASGLIVWAARRRGGDRDENGNPLTLEAACDFPMSKLSIESEPGDPKVPDAADPTRPPRKVSGQGGKPRGAGHRAKTSKKPSTSESS